MKGKQFCTENVDIFLTETKSRQKTDKWTREIISTVLQLSLHFGCQEKLVKKITFSKLPKCGFKIGKTILHSQCKYFSDKKMTNEGGNYSALCQSFPSILAVKKSWCKKPLFYTKASLHQVKVSASRKRL